MNGDALIYIYINKIKPEQLLVVASKERGCDGFIDIMIIVNILDAHLLIQPEHKEGNIDLSFTKGERMILTDKATEAVRKEDRHVMFLSLNQSELVVGKRRTERCCCPPQRRNHKPGNVLLIVFLLQI